MSGVYLKAGRIQIPSANAMPLSRYDKMNRTSLISQSALAARLGGNTLLHEGCWAESRIDNWLSLGMNPEHQ